MTPPWPADALVLPPPPSVNHLYVFSHRRGPILGPLARAWREAAEAACAGWIARQSWVPPPADWRVAVEVWVQWGPGARVVDPDNLAKALLDALQASGVLTDDRWALYRVQDVLWGPETVLAVRVVPVGPMPPRPRPNRRRARPMRQGAHEG